VPIPSAPVGFRDFCPRVLHFRRSLLGNAAREQNHAHGNAENRRRDRAVVRAAEEVALTSTRPKSVWRS
jgi:hypothetical protein